MPEDEHSPAGDEGRSSNGGGAGPDGQLLARLEQLERAFGEQSARLRALETQLGLAKYEPKPRPFAQGASHVADAPRSTGEAAAGTPTPEGGLHPGASENRDAASGINAAPLSGEAAPFVSRRPSSRSRAVRKRGRTRTRRARPERVRARRRSRPLSCPRAAIWNNSSAGVS